jgi:AcrR family transcriptional regulator
MGGRRAYHHGDLRAALVKAALALIAERGIDALSVAEAARRSSVSAAAPYRHFPTRAALLKAAAVSAADQLSSQLQDGLSAQRTGDACDALAVAGGIYTRFVIDHRAGFDLIFAEQLQSLGDPALATAGRAVMDVLLGAALRVTGGEPVGALTLLEQQVAAAHGFATLFLSGFGRRRPTSIDEVVRSSEDTCRLLAHAARPD